MRDCLPPVVLARASLREEQRFARLHRSPVLGIIDGSHCAEGLAEAHPTKQVAKEGRALALSVTRQQFDQDWRFHHAVYELVEAKAKQRTGSKWNWDQFESFLLPVEFDTHLVLNFVFSWENNGRFVDTVAWYADQFDRVDRAFRRLGFSTASALMPRALELEAIQTFHMKEDFALPEDIGAEVKRINGSAGADVSEERLTAAIMSRAGEFTV